MNKKVVVGIAIFCVIVVISVVIAVTSLNNKDDVGTNTNIDSSEKVTNKNDKVELDNFKGRAIKSQSSIVYKKGSTVYYANKASLKEGLGNIAKMDLSSENKEIIYSDVESILFMDDSKVYIPVKESVYKNASMVSIDLDGKNKVELVENIGACINIINNEIYYTKNSDTRDYNLYKYNMDTKSNTMLVEFGFSDMVNGTNIGIYNDKIYYTKSESEGKVAVFSINLDGSNSQKLFDIKKENVQDLIVLEDYILYLSNEVLDKVNLDGTNEKKISTIITNNIAVTDNYIYYLGDATYKLYRMDLDGNNNVMLVDAGIDQYDVIDDKIYYYNRDDSFNMYMCDNNGENVECISIH